MKLELSSLEVAEAVRAWVEKRHPGLVPSRTVEFQVTNGTTPKLTAVVEVTERVAVPPTPQSAGGPYR